MSLILLFTTALPASPPTPIPAPKLTPASIADGIASPNPPDKNRNTSEGRSQRTSVARCMDGPPSDARLCASAALAISASSTPSKPSPPAASPPAPYIVLFSPSYPLANPAGISFNPPRNPSRPGFGAFNLSK